MTVLLKTCPSTRDCISDVPLTEGNHSATPLGSLDVLLQTENVNTIQCFIVGGKCQGTFVNKTQS